MNVDLSPLAMEDTKLDTLDNDNPDTTDNNDNPEGK